MHARRRVARVHRRQLTHLSVVLWCGDATQFDQQLVSYIFSVMTRDALLTSHPVSAEIRDPDDITLYFDAISYDKVSPVGGGEAEWSRGNALDCQ